MVANSLLLAQAGLAGTVAHWAIVLIVIAAMVAILYAVLRAAGLTIPPVCGQVAWIVLAAALGIAAILLLLRLAGGLL